MVGLNHNSFHLNEYPGRNQLSGATGRPAARDTGQLSGVEGAGGALQPAGQGPKQGRCKAGRINPAVVEVKLQQVLQADQLPVQQGPTCIPDRPECDGVKGVNCEGDRSGGGDKAGHQEAVRVATPVDGAGEAVSDRALQSR